MHAWASAVRTYSWDDLIVPQALRIEQKTRRLESGSGSIQSTVVLNVVYLLRPTGDCNAKRTSRDADRNGEEEAAVYRAS